MGSQLAEQIAQMKQQMAMGQQVPNQGTAGSGWGVGTTPYAVNPAEAPNTKPTEERQGDKSAKDTPAEQFEPLYSPEEYANSTYDAQAHGQLDITQTPQKIEEIRSAPENQQALMQYRNVIGSVASGEESAVAREQVPLEYQDLVKLYFDQLQLEEQDAKKDAPAKKDSSAKKGK